MRSSLLALLTIGCASAPVVQRPPLPPLPRSSIAAALDHRGELALTEEQVTKLQALDDALDREQRDLRDQLSAKKRSTESPGTDPASSSQEPMRQGGAGMGGGGMRGGGGGRHGGGGRARRDEDPEQRSRLLQKIDDNDTAAWLKAEMTLDETQKAKGREIASNYRAALFDRREAMRREHQEE